MTLVKHLDTLIDIKNSFEVIAELRPDLSSLDDFIISIKLQQKEGYHLVGISEEEEVVACLGYRLMHTLAWGKILYIDDLIVREKSRGKGYGKVLLDYAESIARNENCIQIHLDTGYQRYAAHKLYLIQGFVLNGFHISKKLM